MCSIAYTHRSDVSEDIVQEVIVNFFEKRRMNDVRGSVLSYLKGAVIKASIKYIRDNRRLIFEDIEFIISQEIATLIEQEEEDVSVRKLLSYVESLPERSRQILKLILFEDKKHGQVADDLNISVNSVKTQYYRSLVNIKNKFDKMYSLFF